MHHSQCRSSESNWFKYEQGCHGNKMQTSFCNPKCACWRACTTFCHASPPWRIWMNAHLKQKRKRKIHLSNLKHQSADRKAERNDQPAHWLVIRSSASQVCYEVGSSPGASRYQEKTRRKNVFMHSIISAGIMGNLSSTYWPSYTTFECHNASTSLPCTKILREPS